MLRLTNRSTHLTAAAFSCLVSLGATVCPPFGISQDKSSIGSAASAAAALQTPTVMYGVSYYPEYEPTGHLKEDIALMKAAGINTVRMGESTWSLWEPEDGRFEFAAVDRVISALGEAHIQVILGTPTYSIPLWLYKEHPEILAIPLGGGPVFYGMRQNIDTNNTFFRRYAQDVIEHMVRHYRDNPNVIGWQIDNETASNGAANADVFDGFRHHLEKKFGTPEELNKAWLLSYWGQTIQRWDELPPRDAAQSTGYKLEWSRWQQERVTDYLSWQAGIVRRLRRPDQFITQDFSGAMRRDVNEADVARSLDVVSANVYPAMQSAMTGASQALIGDYARSLRHSNYLVTETNAQTTGWSSAWQYPPFDGQLRLNVYANLASGANMIAFWPWDSIHSGQETYWKGLLSHDSKPNRVYEEAARTGQELRTVGSKLTNLRIKNQVAILYSVDSANALDFMPFTHGPEPQWTPTRPVADYGTLVEQLHNVLYDLNVGTDFIFPNSTNLSQYSVIVVPALYIADDVLLNKLADYVKQGGHVLMTFKSGFADQNSTVRYDTMPGPLRDAAGFSYQEFSSIDAPLELRGDPFHVGSHNTVSYWAEFLTPEHAKALAYYDDAFFGRWPAITENSYGKGTLVYEGTWLTRELQNEVMKHVLQSANVAMADSTEPKSVRVRSGINPSGRMQYYFLNFSKQGSDAVYHHAAGVDLLTGNRIGRDQSLKLAPWGVAIIESADQVP